MHVQSSPKTKTCYFSIPTSIQFCRDLLGAMLWYIHAHKQAQPIVDWGKHKYSKLKCNETWYLLFWSSDSLECGCALIVPSRTRLWRLFTQATSGVTLGLQPLTLRSNNYSSSPGWNKRFGNMCKIARLAYNLRPPLVGLFNLLLLLQKLKANQRGEKPQLL